MMALSKDLLDELTCPIHLEYLVEPMALKCLHLLCNKDVDSMVREGQVECPVCHAKSDVSDIKKDFRIQKLLDFVRGDKERTEKQQMCEFCEQEGATSKCHDCDMFFGDNCFRGHMKIQATKGHEIRKISEIKAINKEKIQRMITEINDTSTKYEQVKRQWMETIEEFDSTLREIGTNKSKMQELINNDNDKELTDENMIKQLMSTSRTNCKILDNISKSGKEQHTPQNIEIEKLASDDSEPEHQVDHMPATMSVSLKDYASRELQSDPVYVFKGSPSPHAIAAIGKEIWVLLSDNQTIEVLKIQDSGAITYHRAITIHKKSRCYTIESTFDVQAITEAYNGSILVASNGITNTPTGLSQRTLGLLVMNRDGEVVEIVDGDHKYLYVCADRNYICGVTGATHNRSYYSYSHATCYIKWFEYKSKGWTILRTVKLLSYVPCFHCISPNVLKYTASSQIIRCQIDGDKLTQDKDQVKIKGTLLNLCDNSGNALVVQNKQCKVLTPTDEILPLTYTEQLTSPQSAAIDCNGRVLLLCTYQRQAAIVCIA